MKSGSNTALPPRCCGKCGKTIRLRGDANVVLCTAILDVVDAGIEDVCEHYEERNEASGQSFSK